jgi:hypothetical protein
MSETERGDWELPESPDDDAPDTKPVVVLQTGDAPRVTRRIKKLLIEASQKPDCPASDKIFRRVFDMVHLSRNELSAEDQARGFDDDYHVADDLLVRTCSPEWFGDRVEREIDFRRLDDKGKPTIPAEPSQKLLRRIGAINTKEDFQQIKGTIETPTLREAKHGYSLLNVPGYDRKSGLYYDPGRTVFPDIPNNPTKADAARMLELFTGDRGILKDFPFTDGPSEPKGLSLAVALAMLLTAVARRPLVTAPMFAIDAYEAQSGKTLLGHIAGALATGRQIAVRPWATDEYQRKNDLAMALEAGDPVLLYDNLGPEAPLTGDCFNLAITSPTLSTRRLGSNSGADALVAPTNVLLIGTGNHMVIGGDMAEGRVLLTRIIPDRELWQRKFLYRDLLQHVLKNRPQLVAALLTILRGYAVAADKREPTKFRHHEWGDLVAGAVAWLGLPDPVFAETRAKTTDPHREVQEDVVRAWAKAFGDQWLEVHKLIGNPTVAGFIAGFYGMEQHRLTYKTATPFFRDLIGIPRLGFKVEHQPGDGNHRPARWRLASARPDDKDRHAEFKGLGEAEREFGADPI